MAMSSNIPNLLQTGFEHHRSGRLREAEAIYRSILQQQPDHPDALHLLGVMAHQVGRNNDAVDLIEQAIKANPNEPDFYNNCGEAYRALEKYDFAVERYRQALAIRPSFAGALNNLGNAFKDLGRLDEAVEQYKKVLAIEPGFVMAHNNLGICLKQMGNMEQAISHFQQAIAGMPAYAEAHNNLGNTLQELGKFDEAIKHYQQAVTIMPAYTEAHSNLGNALRSTDRLQEAIDHYRQAIDLNPDFAMAHYNLGIALDESGKPEQAILSYERAIAIKPDYAEACHNLGFVLQELGRSEEALSRYQQALAINPDYATVHLHLSMLKPEPGSIPVIERLLAETNLEENEQAMCCFALGNIHHDCKQYDEAFGYFKRANELKRGSIKYDAASFSNHVDRLIQTFSKAYFARVAGNGNDSELPVFVVGMPRSGTTLVEQILASHPQLYGVGELESIARIEKALSSRPGVTSPYPECMTPCDAGVLQDAARSYLDELRELAGDAARVSNKDPGNFHRLGLVMTLFPNARIIHCRRNAMDTCVSIYFNHFSKGSEYSFDLEELGRYYLDYQRLMAHWEGLFPGKILTMQYEELVMEQEKYSRRLIEHVNLAWDDRCLDFHKNRRAVRTASSTQVRRPIYTDSIDRWKHYEKHLAPLASLLAQV